MHHEEKKSDEREGLCQEEGMHRCPFMAVCILWQQEHMDLFAFVLSPVLVMIIK